MRYYVSDLDGTLLGSNAELSEYSNRVLRKFLKKNKMTFFTARSYQVAKRILGDIPFNLPCAVLNGCYIMDYVTGEVLEQHTLERKVVNDITEIARASDISPIFIGNINDEEKMIYFDYYNMGYANFIEQRKEKKDKRLVKMDSLEKILLNDEFSFLTIQFVDKKEKLEYLKQKLRDYDVNLYLGEELYCKGYYYLNITPTDATKEEALENIAELMSVDLKEFTVFGDQENDIGMFCKAGDAFAVENAIPELKECATGIIGANTDEGVAKFLEKVMRCKYD